MPLRERRGREGVADHALSHPPFEERPDLGSPAESERPALGHPRRKSLPPAVLENEVKHFQEHRKLKKANTVTLTNSQGVKKPTEYRSPELSIEEHDPPYELDSYHAPHEPAISPIHQPARTLNDHIGQAFPPNKSLPRNYSHGHALNQLRQDLKDKLHPPPTQTAWRSQPASRNHSRHGSRIPSSTSTRNSSIQSGLEDLHDEEEDPIIFHNVKSKTLPRNFGLKKLLSRDTVGSLSQDDGTHLPALSTPHHPPPTRGGGRHPSSDMTPHRRNGLRASSGDKYQVNTDLSIDAVLTEVLRVAGNLKMRESELQGHTLSCYWRGVRFKLSVQKDRYETYHFVFRWDSGGDLSKYSELCERFMKKLKLS